MFLPHQAAVLTTEFGEAAAKLGSLLAMSEIDVVYGGGGIGLDGKTC